MGSDIDYAIFSGDAPAHDVWAQTAEANFAHTQAVIDLYRTYFPGTPLYYSLGNHEGYEANYSLLTHPYSPYVAGRS